MNMRLISLLLAAILALSVTACGSEQDTSAPAEAESAQTEEAAPESEAQTDETPAETETPEEAPAEEVPEEETEPEETSEPAAEEAPEEPAEEEPAPVGNFINANGEAVDPASVAYSSLNAGIVLTGDAKDARSSGSVHEYASNMEQVVGVKLCGGAVDVRMQVYTQNDSWESKYNQNSIDALVGSFNNAQGADESETLTMWGADAIRLTAYDHDTIYTEDYYVIIPAQDGVTSYFVKIEMTFSADKLADNPDYVTAGREQVMNGMVIDFDGGCAYVGSWAQ